MYRFIMRQTALTEFNEENYQFEDIWDVDGTDISWQKDGREKLNKVIEMYNAWQIDGFFNHGTPRLLATIEHGIQTFGARDGGSGYMEVLQRMKKFVREYEGRT